MGERSIIERLVASTIGRRLDVREARDRVADAQRAAMIAKWNLLPDLQLNISYTRRSFGSPAGALLADLFNGLRVSVNTTYALDRASAASGVESAHVAIRAAVRAAHDLEENVAAEIRRAYRARLRAAEAMAIQKQSLDVAQRQLRFAELRYERGLADNFDVIDAEANVFQARSDLIAATVDRALAVLALSRATGLLDPDEFLR
ncbi:MAG: TolC family protein [Acidobacteria bacterium]|nr:TolC family protein [Acidobacteriota bacterium]MBI3263249.1 TolC family protein [Acidobacteriota bacterium]